MRSERVCLTQVKRGDGVLRKPWSLLAVLLLIAVLAHGAGCGGTPADPEQSSRKEDRREWSWETSRWKPPSSVAASGTLNPGVQAGTDGCFIVHSGWTDYSGFHSLEIFTTAIDMGSRYPGVSSQQRVTDGPVDDHPSVSQDGETIVYEHSKANPSGHIGVEDIGTKGVIPTSAGVFAVSSRGGQSRQVTPASWMTLEGWSPIVEPKPGTTGVKRDCISPSFSPDGRTICLVIQDRAFPSWESRSALAIVPADGSSEPEIIYLSLGANDAVSCPKYSPDGKWIYFCSGGGIKREPAEGGSVQWIIRPREMESRGGSGTLASAVPLSLQSLFRCEEEESESVNEVRYLTFDFAREQPGLYAVAVCGGLPRGWPTQIELMGMEGEDPRPIYGGSDSIKVKPDQISVSSDGRWLAFSNGSYTGGNQGPIYALDLKNLQTRVVADGYYPCFGVWSAGAR